MAVKIGTGDVVRTMMERSPKSAYGVSREMRRNRNYVIRAMERSNPTVGTVAAVADVTGHDVAIVDRGTGDIVAVIAPPPRDERATD